MSIPEKLPKWLSESDIRMGIVPIYDSFELRPSSSVEVNFRTLMTKEKICQIKMISQRLVINESRIIVMSC